MPYPMMLNDAQGDAEAIDRLLKTKLTEIQKGNWAILYRHQDTMGLWDLVYPQSEMHGGGPRLLRQLNHDSPDKWEPYPTESDAAQAQP